MEEVIDYGISVEVTKDSIRSVDKLEKTLTNMQKKINSATSSTMQMQAKQHRLVQKQGMASKTLLAQKLKQEERLDALKTKQAFGNMSSSHGKTGMKAKGSLLAEQLKEEVKLENKVNSIMRKQLLNAEGISDEKRKEFRATLMKEKSIDDILEAERKISKEARQRVKTRRAELKQMKKLNFMQQRMISSSKQLLSGGVSAFAVTAGGVGIVQQGMQFEAINNTMLAVSDSTDEAADNMKFLREESYRLGLNLSESGRAYSKMLANRGEMSREDAQQAFLGVSEMATVLGLTAPESGRALKALEQMLAKTKVSAEELRGQMADSGLAGAIEMMALSAQDAGLTVNGTVAELEKLMEQGKVASDKVIPHFSRRMREAARQGGALGNALNGSRVAMGRFLNIVARTSGETIFPEMEKQLSEFFNTASESIEDLEPLWRAFGRILGATLKVLSVGIKLITTPLLLLGHTLDAITEKLGDFTTVVATTFVTAMVMWSRSLLAASGATGIMIGKIALLNVALLTLLRRVGVVLAPLLALEEVYNGLVGKDKEGFFYSPSRDKESPMYDPSLPPKTNSEVMSSTAGSTNLLLTYAVRAAAKLDNMFSDTDTANSERVTSAIRAANTPVQTETKLNVTLMVDGEQLGSSVGNTQSMSDLIYSAYSNMNR